MDLAEISRIHDRHWQPGWGSVTAEELLYFQDLIARHRPRSFIEVGTASGLSGGLIALLLEEYGGRRLTTLDHDNTFFGDETKENGFLLEAIYPSGPVTIERRPFTISVDVPSLGGTWDMGFVDANHWHPWPLLDTLALAPYLRGDRILLHHDLDLYRKQTKVYGIGPKYLWDQWPDSHRDRATTNHGNLFSLSLDLPEDRIEQIAVDALSLPWSLRLRIRPAQLERVRSFLADHYSPRVLATFDETAGKFNQPL